MLDIHGYVVYDTDIFTSRLERLVLRTLFRGRFPMSSSSNMKASLLDCIVSPWFQCPPVTLHSLLLRCIEPTRQVTGVMESSKPNITACFIAHLHIFQAHRICTKPLILSIMGFHCLPLYPVWTLLTVRSLRWVLYWTGLPE